MSLRLPSDLLMDAGLGGGGVGQSCHERYARGLPKIGQNNSRLIRDVSRSGRRAR